MTIKSVTGPIYFYVLRYIFAAPCSVKGGVTWPWRWWWWQYLLDLC